VELKANRVGSEGSARPARPPERCLPLIKLNEIKQAILNAIGSEPAAVELTATKGQFIITLVNSNLTSGLEPRRESEASRIAEGIADVIAEMPEYQGIEAIHIGYVSRNPDGSASRIIDGTDFRKDPQGKFQDHIT